MAAAAAVHPARHWDHEKLASLDIGIGQIQFQGHVEGLFDVPDRAAVGRLTTRRHIATVIRRMRDMYRHFFMQRQVEEIQHGTLRGLQHVLGYTMVFDLEIAPFPADLVDRLCQFTLARFVAGSARSQAHDRYSRITLVVSDIGAVIGIATHSFPFPLESSY